jgi:hypothetical protein
MKPVTVSLRREGQLAARTAAGHSGPAELVERQRALAKLAGDLGVPDPEPGNGQIGHRQSETSIDGPQAP